MPYEEDKLQGNPEEETFEKKERQEKASFSINLKSFFLFYSIIQNKLNDYNFAYKIW